MVLSQSLLGNNPNSDVDVSYTKKLAVWAAVILHSQTADVMRKKEVRISTTVIDVSFSRPNASPVGA